MLRSIKLQTPTLPLPLTIWRVGPHGERMLDFDPVLLGRRSYAHVCAYKPVLAATAPSAGQPGGPSGGGAPPGGASPAGATAAPAKVLICRDGPPEPPPPDSGELTLGMRVARPVRAGRLSLPGHRRQLRQRAGAAVPARLHGAGVRGGVGWLRAARRQGAARLPPGRLAARHRVQPRRRGRLQRGQRHVPRHAPAAREPDRVEPGAPALPRSAPGRPPGRLRPRAAQGPRRRAGHPAVAPRALDGRDPRPCRATCRRALPPGNRRLPRRRPPSRAPSRPPPARRPKQERPPGLRPPPPPGRSR